MGTSKQEKNKTYYCFGAARKKSDINKDTWSIDDFMPTRAILYKTKNDALTALNQKLQSGSGNRNVVYCVQIKPDGIEFE